MDNSQPTNGTGRQAMAQKVEDAKKPDLSKKPRALDLPSNKLSQTNTLTMADEGEDKPFDVFLSHAGYGGGKKQGLVSLLYEELLGRNQSSADATTSNNNLRVFLDRDDSISLPPGQPAPPRLVWAAATCKVMVVVLSPAYLTRQWTLLELEIALARNRHVHPHRGGTTQVNLTGFLKELSALAEEFGLGGLDSVHQYYEQLERKAENTDGASSGDDQKTVKAHGLPVTVLPLFFGLSPSDCQDVSGKILRKHRAIGDQFGQWSVGDSTERDRPHRWVTALSTVARISGPVYIEPSQTHLQYARRVAGIITNQLLGKSSQLRRLVELEEKRKAAEQQKEQQQWQSSQGTFAGIRRDLSLTIHNQSKQEMTPARLSEDYVGAIIQTETVLGSGFFGTVYRAYDQTLNTAFAIKTNRVPLSLLDKDQLEHLKKTFRTELDTLHQFKHPNIVSLYGYYMTDNLDGQQYLLYELAEKGALSEFWKSDLGRDRLASFQTRALIAMGVLTAVQFLHVGSEKVGRCFHRDIKSENIVIMADMTPKLIDCGLAKLVPNHGMASVSSGVKGTDEYMCPQYQRGILDSYKEECDIFSFGVVMVELWTGRLQNHRESKNNKRVDFFHRYTVGRKAIDFDVDDALDISVEKELPDNTKEFANLAVQCMSYELEDRPKGEDLLLQIQDICSRSQANTGEEKDVQKKLEKDYPPSTSIKRQCRLCRTANVRCFPVPSSGYLCLPCLLAKTRSEARAEFDSLILREIRSLRTENRQLHKTTHTTLESSADVLSSLDARLVNKIPSLFVLLPEEPAALRQHPRSWLREKARRRYRLYFVCAHSYRKVKSVVKFRVSEAWIASVAPVLACSLHALQLAIQAPTRLDFGLGSLASTVFNEIDSDKVDEMMGALKEILDEETSMSTANRRLLANLELGRLESSDIRSLNKETIELVVELAASQRGWVEEMTQVRSLDVGQTKWVLNEYATRQHCYQRVDSKSGSQDDDKAPTVFLSHTGKDKLASFFVEILNEKLRDYGMDTFLDSSSLEAGVEWQKEIKRCVRNCTVFVCILSEAYFRRNWCMVELDVAFESGKRIIPVCHGCSAPEVDETVRSNLSEVLKEKHGFVDPSTLDRWCANLRTLKGIQGIRNKWSSKHDQIQFRDDVVAAILKEINRQAGQEAAVEGTGQHPSPLVI